MNNRIIITLIFTFCFFNLTYSQIYSDQGLKRSSLLKVEKIKWDKITFVTGGLSINPVPTAIYGMIGTVRRVGPYASIKTNFNFNYSYDLEGSAYDSNHYFNDKVHINRFALTGGVLWRIFKPVILYEGIGYGNRNVTWETVSGKRYRVDSFSYNGLQLESGILYKFNNVLISGGINIGESAEFYLGMGITLKNKKL